MEIDAISKITIPYIGGDGIGPEVISSMRQVIDSIIPNINWLKINHDDYDIINKYNVAIKGPLGTPIGAGHRSYNVQMRQELDLYACIRPIEWYGSESPVKHPEKCNMVIFRENTEDVYAGIELTGRDAWDIWLHLPQELGQRVRFPFTSNFALKPISEDGSRRIMKKACEYAISHPQYHNHITIVHKGNIMKNTEGSFREWCYNVAQEYPQLKVDDCICDAFLQNSLLTPENYDIIVTTNLNGDYISDALAAQVGGIGISPGVNMNDVCAVFEATHGTAPNIVGKGIANPCSCILSGAMMCEYLGYKEESDKIKEAVRKAIRLNPQTTQEYTDLIIYYLHYE